MTEDEFLILDDEDYDSTQAKPESPKISKVQSGSDNSASIGSLGGTISDIQGMLGQGISKIRSSISSARQKKVAKEESLEELVLDDGSLEKVRPIAGKGADSADLLEAELVVDGVEQFEWQIRGMDCPDCAMKATRAVNRLPGTNEVIVSATEGSVRVNIDLARGRVSRVSSVLDSLGHSPDVEWRLVQGKTAGEVSNRLGIDRKGLRNALLEIPGILNASLDDGRIELQQIPTDSQKVSEMTEEGLRRLFGEYTLVESKNKRLRPDQVQLIGAVMTIPLLFAVFAIEMVEMHWWVPGAITVLGVLFAGLPMFQAAIASIQNRVLGFQVLTSLAVLGALYLKEWPEALIVTGLVALAGHLEESALVRAREAMQGGLDRLPRRARLVGEGQNIDNPCDDEWTPVAALEPGDIVE
ncbi:MAG: cation transporter, partial [Euryarchaeota archaeon]